MVHTVFTDTEESHQLFEMMKKDLQAFIDANIEDMNQRSDFYESFVDKYH